MNMIDEGRRIEEEEDIIYCITPTHKRKVYIYTKSYYVYRMDIRKRESNNKYVRTHTLKILYYTYTHTHYIPYANSLYTIHYMI